MKILQIQRDEKENTVDVNSQNLVTEKIIQPLLNMIHLNSIDVICIGEWGKCVAAHLSLELGIPCLSGIDELQFTKDALAVSYDAYQANVKIKQDVKPPVILVVKNELEDILMDPDAFEVKRYPICVEAHTDAGAFVLEKEEVPGDFGQDTILVIGHGVGSKENAREICAFAEKYGFGVGATRPVVTDGWVTSRHLIGISGSVIAPEVCIVLGASGSQAFMAGIGKSGTIFSVNADEHAMIFEKSDYGLVMDCMQFIRKLEVEWGRSSDV